MDLLRIAARVSARTAQEGQGEGSGEVTAQQEQVGYVKKTPGKGYCVKSEKNPDWSGGCYPSKGEAKDRLKQVEKFKHMKGSVEVGEKDLAIVVSSSGATRVFLGGHQIGVLSKLAVVASADRIPNSFAMASFAEGLPAEAFDRSQFAGRVRSQAAALAQLPFFAHVSTPDGTCAEEAERCAEEEETAVAPPGWEKTVKKMKKHEDIENPYALSWYMKEKGAKPSK